MPIGFFCPGSTSMPNVQPFLMLLVLCSHERVAKLVDCNLQYYFAPSFSQISLKNSLNGCTELRSTLLMSYCISIGTFFQKCPLYKANSSYILYYECITARNSCSSRIFVGRFRALFIPRYLCNRIYFKLYPGRNDLKL